MQKNKKICLIFSTFPDEISAKFVIKKLINKKKIACANIISNITSYFYWNKKIQKKIETQVFFKTTLFLMKKTISKIKKYHPYDIPEILILKTFTDTAYFEWIKKTLKIKIL